MFVTSLSARIGQVTRLAVAVIALVTLVGCSGLPFGAGGSSGKDFSIVAYQGDDLLGGKQSKFTDVFRQKKPVVLNFWAGQCPPCRAEMPEFQKVADEYEGKVIFVGIDVGPFTGLGNHDEARRLLDELGIKYPAAYAVDASPLQPFSVKAMPTTVYLTADGNVRSTVNGIVREAQLRSELDALLKS